MEWLEICFWKEKRAAKTKSVWMLCTDIFLLRPSKIGLIRLFLVLASFRDCRETRTQENQEQLKQWTSPSEHDLRKAKTAPSARHVMTTHIRLEGCTIRPIQTIITHRLSLAMAKVTRLAEFSVCVQSFKCFFFQRR